MYWRIWRLSLTFWVKREQFTIIVMSSSNTVLTGRAIVADSWVAAILDDVAGVAKDEEVIVMVFTRPRFIAFFVLFIIVYVKKGTTINWH